jgi:hypothetical protein
MHLLLPKPLHDVPPGQPIRNQLGLGGLYVLVESIAAKHHLVVKVQVVQIVVKNLPLIDWLHDVY